MNLETMKCPNCGAPLYFPNPNQDFCFCSSCGTQVYKPNSKLAEMKIKEDNKRKYEKNLIIMMAISMVFAIAMILALSLLR